jgi:multidrug efflux pump subunit AcrB
VYVALIGLTGFQMARMPTGFIPEQDIGYLVVVVQLPPGSSLARTDEVVRQVNDIALKIPGMEHTSPVTGFDVTTSTVSPNAATIFVALPSLYGRNIPGVNAAAMLKLLREKLSVINDAYVIAVMPPPVQGLGSAGGFNSCSRIVVASALKPSPRRLTIWSRQPTRTGRSRASSPCTTPALPRCSPTSTG